MKPHLFSAILALAVANPAHGKWIPPTVPEMEAKAKRVLHDCGAENVVSISIPEASSIQFKPLKEPHERTAYDLKALRCVAKEYRDLSSYEEIEVMLIGIVDSE